MQEKVCVVGDEGAGRSEMDDGSSCRGRFTQEVDMGHHIVAEAGLVFGGPLEVDVVHDVAHLTESLFGEGLSADLETDLALRFRQGQPEPTPDSETFGGEKTACISELAYRSLSGCR